MGSRERPFAMVSMPQLWPVYDRATQLWPVSDRSCGRSLTEPRPRPKVSGRMGRPSVGPFGGVGRPSPNRGINAAVVAGLRPQLWPVSDRATPPTEGLRANGETFGRTFRRGRETLAEPRPQLWPVSDRATPPTEGLQANGETFGRTFRRGRETLAEPGSGDPRRTAGPSPNRILIAFRVARR